jgi:hypothetical protein
MQLHALVAEVLGVKAITGHRMRSLHGMVMISSQRVRIISYQHERSHYDGLS